MTHFTDLEVWKAGIELMKEVYRLTKNFPQREMYELTAQIRSASTSILANIAEGFGRFTYPDKSNKYIIARGECAETEAFLHMAVALQLIDKKDAKQAFILVEKVGKMISGLITYYQKSKPSKF